MININKKFTRKNCLAIVNANLAKEWNTSKNGELTPYDVTPGSARKVWWKCSKGHEWEATISNRNNGTSCPYCSNRKVGEDNNLAVSHPDIAKEWHPQKNGKWTPSDFTAGSNKKAWWICPKGHAYEAQIKSRKRGIGCPFCGGKKGSNKKKVSKDYNLAVTHPYLIEEWHSSKNGNLTPYDVTPGSNKKVWWNCKKNKDHVWKAPIVTRTSGHGCAVCAGKIVGDYNNLQFLKPDLAEEWHPTKNGNLLPKDFTIHSGKKVWWLCKFNHEWQARIADRVNGVGCRKCSKQQTSKLEIRIYCELKCIFPEIEWRKMIEGDEVDVYLSKYKIAVECDGKYWHKGKDGKDKNKTERLKLNGVNLHRIREYGLPKLSNRDIICEQKEGDFEIVSRALENILSYSVIDDNDRLRITGYLDNKKLVNMPEYLKTLSLLPGPPLDESLFKLFPKLCEEWDYTLNAPLLPSMFTPGSGRRVSWKCNKGKGHPSWPAAISSRCRTAGSGCPYCDGKKVCETNNLAFLRPDIAEEWHPTLNVNLTPHKVTPGSHITVFWQCKKYKEDVWPATIYTRTQGHGCPYCAGQKATFEYNLLTENPKLASEWHPVKNGMLKPTDLLPKSNRKVWWICNNNHEWKASVDSRSRGRGCPFCANINRIYHLNKRRHEVRAKAIKLDGRL